MSELRDLVSEKIWSMADRFFPDWTANMIDVAQEHGLTIGELETLFELHWIGSCKMSEIARRTSLSRAAVSQMIDRLVDQNLVERQENPEDRREKVLALSVEGRRVTSGFQKSLIRQIAESMKEVPDGALREMLAAVDKVLPHMPDPRSRD